MKSLDSVEIPPQKRPKQYQELTAGVAHYAAPPRAILTINSTFIHGEAAPIVGVSI